MFYMHRCYGGRWSCDYEKEGVIEVALVGPQRSCGTFFFFLLQIFQSGMGPSKPNISKFSFFYCEFEAPSKK